MKSPTIDSGYPLSRISLSAEDEKMALASVNPLFLAYLQNKIAAYSLFLVDSQLQYHADPKQQVQAILEHERLRNFVTAYRELMNEVVAAQSEHPL